MKRHFDGETAAAWCQTCMSATLASILRDHSSIKHNNQSFIESACGKNCAILQQKNKTFRLCFHLQNKPLAQQVGNCAAALPRVICRVLWTNLKSALRFMLFCVSSPPPPPPQGSCRFLFDRVQVSDTSGEETDQRAPQRADDWESLPLEEI